MTSTSKVTRTVCTLSQGGVGGVKLINIAHDRLVYAMVHHSEVSMLLTRPFLPLEPIVIGILESGLNYGGLVALALIFYMVYVLI